VTPVGFAPTLFAGTVAIVVAGLTRLVAVAGRFNGQKERSVILSRRDELLDPPVHLPVALEAEAPVVAKFAWFLLLQRSGPLPFVL
jgi:hypothetical protein